MSSVRSVLSSVLTEQVSAGELGHDPKALEDRLSHISQSAHRWKTLVLLDEADVFVQARSTVKMLVSRSFFASRNTIKGIMFLTTNRVRVFDDAIQSRVTLAMRYDSLSVAT